MNSLSARPVAVVELRLRSRFRDALVLTCLSAAAHGAMAQGQPLESVVVTATRTPMRVDDAIADVTVIDREALQRTEGRTLVDVLAQQAGIQATSNGGLGKSSSLFIRGLESRHTLLLIDGVRYGSATLGTPVWETLPIEQIDRIEIVRGPLSSLYGSGAVGGVIQVFTRRGAQGLLPNVSIAAGSEHYGKVAGGVRFGNGPMDGAIQLQRTTVRGFSATNPKVQFGSYNADNDGFSQNAGSGRLGLSFGEGWRADVSYLHTDGVSRIDDGPGVDARARLIAEVMAAEVGGPIAGPWRSLVRASRSTDAYNTLSSTSVGNLGTIQTVQEQLTWENSIATPVGKIAVIGEHLSQKTSRPVTPFTQTDRTINGLALGLDGGTGPHHWQASVRRDRNSQYGKQDTGSAGYGLDLPWGLRAGASYGTSFVSPSFNQLYFPGFGNANLQPEEGKHAEGSLRWKGRDQEARLAWFSNRIRGYISSGPLPTNIPRTRMDGVSLSYQAKVDIVNLSAAVDHVDPRNVTPGSSYDKQLPRRARNSVKAAADSSYGAFSGGVGFVAFSNRFDNTTNTLRVAGYGTVDLHADWRFRPDMTLGLRLNNLADKRYETVYGYNQPGREVFVTLRYEAK